ncbi:MAG: ion transporter [Spirochaetales bacterium]|nr:ion transporter [Spirochaetales bacterium]
MKAQKIRLLIDPDHRLKQAWDGWVVLLTIFASIELPLRFVLKYEMPHWLAVVDTTVVASFLIDIVLNFFTKIYVAGKPVSSKRRIAIQYLKTWFIIDFVAAFPFDLLVGPGLIKLTDATRILRLFRLMRLSRLAQVMQKIGRADIINTSILRMIFFIFWMILIMHWNACIWMALGGNPNDSPESYRYLRSLYWSVTTITTIGFGDITPQNGPQTLYTIFIELLGAGMYGYVIGNIASLLANIDVARANWLEKMEKINYFMRYRQIPLDIQESIRNYYSYLWESRRGYDELHILEDLPSSLRLQVAMFLNRNIIEKVPIFKGASDELIRQIIMNLRPVVYTPGDYIFRKGEVGTSMYFISKGSVEVVSEDGQTVFATLTEGNFFGEIALLLKQPRTASIKAVDYCDLYLIEQETFNRILTDFPEFADKIHDMVQQRQAEIDSTAQNAVTGLPRHAPVPVERVLLKKEAMGILIDWPALVDAAIYQIIRYNQRERRWMYLNKCIQISSYVDWEPLDQTEHSYRVRALNQAGTGAWSEITSIRSE